MFNTNFQNTVPNQSTEINPYQDQYFGQNDKTPYREGMTVPMPQPMSGNVSEENMYPLESSLATPGLSIPVGANNSVYTNYAEGGEVKNKKAKKEKNNPYPSLAEMIRQQGQGEDSILAHINPLEAMMLQQMGGSGTINPVTGLPQYSFWSKPWKAMKSVIGGAGGAILGNMILPGVGGVIGGALGQGGQNALRGKSIGMGALKGGLAGAMLPSAASALGAGASGLGMNSAGNFLSNYGAENALLPSLGLGRGGVPAGDTAISANPLVNNMVSNTGGIGTLGAANNMAAPQSFMDKLSSNTGSFLSKPKNLLSLATIAGSFANRPKEKKEKSPEQLGQEYKRLENAKRKTKAEIEADEAAEFLKNQANYRLRHNLAGGESLAASPIYRKVNSPEEYKKNNRWLEYYPNQEFTGNPILMKMGGEVNKFDPRNLKMNNTNELSWEWPNLKPYVLNDINEQKGINSELEGKYGQELQRKRDFHKGRYDNLYAQNQGLVKKIGEMEGGQAAMDRVNKMQFKEGGSTLPRMMIEEEEIEYPSGLGFYLKGNTGGQDDKRPMKLPEGSYIIDASTVSDLGDGNSEAGKKQLDALVSDGEYYMAPKTVSNMGKGNNNLGARKLDEMVKNIRQHKRGGSIHLPPKTKSLASYMMR
jgi:hypothetical protein